MNIRVRLFARASQLTGVSELELELPSGSSVRDLRAVLQQQHPALQPLMPSLFVAINAEYADLDQPIPDGAEVACFPPVSGG